MKKTACYLTSLVILLMAGCSQGRSAPEANSIALADAENLKSIIVAGGCFWCVEADFDKLEGVIDTQSGYTGGHVDQPSYKQVTYEDTGHYEAVKVTYDPEIVSFDQLIDYYWKHVDPTDEFGQFCDRGESYRSAIFVSGEAERELAERSKAEIEQSGVLELEIVTPILDRQTFWPAEEYHQDYYQKNPLRYRYYRASCGRDKRVKQVWGQSNSD